MSAFYFDNAMAWAQFRLKGGWKNVITVVPVVIALMVVVCVLVDQANPLPHDRMEAMTAMTGCLLGLQCLVLLVICTMRVRSAVISDLASRRIESHRMMPLSTHQAVMGYISGGLLQLLFISLAVFAVGCGTCMAASIQIQTWLLANFILFMFALMLWCATIMMAFVSRGLFWIMLISVCIILMNRGDPLPFVPALLTLATPMYGYTIFNLLTGHRTLTNVVEVAVGGQILLSILCVNASARKYAKDEALAWPVLPSLAVLCIWVALSWYGVNHVAEISPHRFYRYNSGIPYGRDMTSLVLGGLFSSILVAMMTMSAAAWSDILASQKRDANPAHGKFYLPSFPMALVVAIAAILCLTQISVPDFDQNGQWALAATCAMTFTQVYLLMRCFYGQFTKANLFIAGLMALQWFIPIVIDLTYYGITQPNAQPHLDFFGPISPLILIVGVYGQTSLKLHISLISQAAILAIVFALFAWLKSRPRKNVIPAALPPLPLPPSLPSLEAPANQA